MLRSRPPDAYTQVVGRWLCLLFVGACGFSVGGSTGNDGSLDGPLTGEAGADASLCYGTGFGRACLNSAPAGPRSISDAVFDTDGAGCTQVTNGLCIVSATELEVPTGASVRALGSRPLVLVATGTLHIVGTIGASSLSSGPGAGAGASTAPCTALTPAGADQGGGAGGAGGSFGGAGGSGGAGDLNDSGLPAGSPAGQVPASPIIATSVRAGCSGGGGGAAVGAAGTGGHGGGAIYLIAGSMIVVTGRVYSVGQGGGAGTLLGAGGGGGSGGLIGLDAPEIISSGMIIANGGGGGEGGGVNSTGSAGADGASNGQPALGGTGNPGGNGGDGSGIGTLDGLPGASVNEGGGGGGGGAGIIYIKGMFTPGASTISPPVTVGGQ